MSQFTSNSRPLLLLLRLLLSASIWPTALARGVPINLYEQPGNWHRGPGDIVNLWIGFTGGGFRPGLGLVPAPAIGGGGGGPVERNAIKANSPNRWTRYQNDRGQFIIPYIISGKFESQEHAIIARAMLAIAENTCIKFEKRGGEADFVDLKNERGEGCYTVVGRAPGKNTVMLETNEIATCLEFDIVIHELMHTIGLWHEQMRYDRDDFIKIHWENIGPAYVTQFEKVPDTDSTTYGVRYDYQSVMHYAKDAFASAPGKITMETLDKQFQEVIGKVRDASAEDYLKICNIYGCHTCMGRPFEPGQSQPVDGQRVLTLAPGGHVTLPTASPSPATLPLRTTTSASSSTTTRASTRTSTRTSSTKGPPSRSTRPPPTRDSKEKEDRRVRPTPMLPIILPLINNNWWWKNTPAPPLRDPHGRRLLMLQDEGENVEEKKSMKEKQKEKVDEKEEKEEEKKGQKMEEEEEEMKKESKKKDEDAKVSVERKKSRPIVKEVAKEEESEEEDSAEILEIIREMRRIGTSVKKGGMGKEGVVQKKKEEEEESVEWREVPDRSEAEEKSEETKSEDEKSEEEEPKERRTEEKLPATTTAITTMRMRSFGKEKNNVEEQRRVIEEKRPKRRKLIKEKKPTDEEQEKREDEEKEESKPKKRRKGDEKKRRRTTMKKSSAETEERPDEEVKKKWEWRECHRDAPFCSRLFHRAPHRPGKNAAALKTCGLEVIKRNCCASCTRSEPVKKAAAADEEEQEEEETDEKEVMSE